MIVYKLILPFVGRRAQVEVRYEVMEPPQKSFHGPRITVKQKYSKFV